MKFYAWAAVAALFVLIAAAIGYYVDPMASLHTAQALPPDLPVAHAGMAMEIIGGYVTAPSTTLTAWTLAAGNSLQIRNCDMTKMVRLLQMWGDWQTAGYLGVRSPKLHDNVRGIRYKGTASDCVPLLPFGREQRLYPQDVLTVEQSGSATGGDIESGALLIHYEDLPGANARLVMPDVLQKRGVNVVTVEDSLVTGTAGGWSGQEAINVETDLLKANTDYALIGYTVDTECCAVRWQGVDTANMGVGGPGNETLRHVTADWFRRLSLAYNLPCIPVFNSANKGAILLDALQDENGADPIVNSIFIELAPS